MNTNFSDEQIRGAIGDKEKEATGILENNEETAKTLGKAKALLERIKHIPVIGGLVDDITTTIELIGDYVKGRYREIPFRVIVSAMGGILYLVSPIDIIPDAIPVIGFLDDAAVLTLIFSTGVSLELSKYRKWKEETERKRIVDEAKEKYISELIAGEKK